MNYLLAPFQMLWRLVTWFVALTGRLLAVLTGFLLLVAGVALTLTVVGAFVGIPLVALGLALIARGLF
ncbi:MAG: hypothetical protein ACYC4L_09440 [Chloroflexota bacterium]